MWRKRGEGLHFQCTSKGKKAGTGGKMANFFVAIAHKRGVVMCEQYEDRLTGAYFAAFVKQHFPTAFEICGNKEEKLFLQDGDPRQNSAPARQALEEIGATMFSIPPRSPDINPIENFFHLIGKKLAGDAVKNNITKETFKQFSRRVKRTMDEYPAKEIDKIIESMDKRMSLIVKAKGQRLKY